MTDPNQPPVNQPSGDQPPAPPAYSPPAAPAYGSAPAAPAYGSAPAAPAYGSAPAAPAYGSGPDQAPAYGSAPAPYTAQGYGAPDASYKYNVLAIISLVSAFFVSLAAIICGHIALSQIKKTGEKGRGLAIAGLVLGYLGVVTTIIVIIFFVLAWVAAINSGYGYSSY